MPIFLLSHTNCSSVLASVCTDNLFLNFISFLGCTKEKKKRKTQKNSRTLQHKNGRRRKRLLGGAGACMMVIIVQLLWLLQRYRVLVNPRMISFIFSVQNAFSSRDSFVPLLYFDYVVSFLSRYVRKGDLHYSRMSFLNREGLARAANGIIDLWRRNKKKKLDEKRVSKPNPSKQPLSRTPPVETNFIDLFIY